jgi:hypothetical protein
MYVISLSNISIKTNFDQITTVKVKCIQYSEGDYIACMTSRYFVVHATCGNTTYCSRHFVSERRLSVISKENVHNVR